METDRIRQLKTEIHWLAAQGKQAARNKDLKRSRELMRKTLPLVDELAKITNSEKYQMLSAMGHALVETYQDRGDRNIH